MAQIRIGQRVQVIDGGLTEYKQFGMVVAAGSCRGWYVQLDENQESTDQTFFHVEELQVVATVAKRIDQSRHVLQEVTS